MPIKQNKQIAVKRRQRSKSMLLFRNLKTTFARARRRAALRDLYEVILWLPPYKVCERALLHLFDNMLGFLLTGARMITIPPRLQTSTEHTGILMLRHEGILVCQTELHLPPEAGHDKRIFSLSTTYPFPTESLLSYLYPLSKCLTP